jgi:single-stranded DNA-specific DHH superfamily exonuclease
MMLMSEEDALIISDWDADGAVSAAIFLDLQSSELFPVKKKINVNLIPAGPRDASKIIKSILGCPSYIALLDIAYIPEIVDSIRDFKQKCPNSEIIYIDHHFSTLEHLKELRQYISKLRVGSSKPTAMHLIDIAHEIGKPLPERLEVFARSVGYIELGKKPSEDMMNVVSLVASIARALKLEKDANFWRKMVRWMSNPLPIPMSKGDLEILNRVSEEAKKKDEELDRAVNDLAIGAQRWGCFRFIDARKRWKRRGVSSLATRLSRKLKSPVALLASVKGGQILVIRTRNNAAKLIADEIVSEGMSSDVGGHGNIVVIKLKEGYSIEKIKQILVRSCRYVA